MMNEKKSRRGSILKVLENTIKPENSTVSSRPKKRVSFAPEPFVKILKEDKSKSFASGLSQGEYKENKIDSESREIDRLLKGQIIGSNDLCNMFTNESNSDTYKMNMTSGFEKPFDIATRFLANGDKKLRRSQIGSMMLDNSFTSRASSEAQSPLTPRRSPRIKAKIVARRREISLTPDLTNKNDDLVSRHINFNEGVLPVDSKSEHAQLEDVFMNIETTPQAALPSKVTDENAKTIPTDVQQAVDFGEKQSVIMDISESILDSQPMATLLSTSALLDIFSANKSTKKENGNTDSCDMDISMDVESSKIGKPQAICASISSKDSKTSTEPEPEPSPAVEMKSVLMDTSFFTKIESESSFDPNYAHSVVKKAKEHQDKILNLSHDLRIFLNMSMTECTEIANQSVNLNNSFNKLNIEKSAPQIKPTGDLLKLFQLNEQIQNLKKQVNLKMDEIKHKRKINNIDRQKKFQECLNQLENSTNCYISQTVAFENYKSDLQRHFDDLFFKRKISFESLKKAVSKINSNHYGIIVQKIDQLQKKHGISFNIIEPNRFHIIIQHITVIDLVLNSDQSLNMKSFSVTDSKFDVYHNVFLIINNNENILEFFNNSKTLEEIGVFISKLNILLNKMILIFKQINNLLKTGFSIIFNDFKFGFTIFLRSVSCFVVWFNILIRSDFNLSISFSSVEHLKGVDLTTQTNQEIAQYFAGNKFEIHSIFELVAKISSRIYEENICSDL